jgi:hypothetical protein
MLWPNQHKRVRARANAVKPEQGAGGRDPREDAEKRESFVQLRERYADARSLVSPDEPYANLEWILGARRNITRDPPRLGTKTVELAALWLQDLAAEVDHRSPPPPAGDFDGNASLSHQAGKLAAQRLRDATVRFLLAFGISPANRTESSSARRFDGGPSRRLP